MSHLLFNGLEAYATCRGGSFAPADLIGCLASDLFICSAAVACGCGLLTYILSYCTGNDSWVDRSWSIVPVLYTYLYVWWEGNALWDFSHLSPRMLYAYVITLWGIRLTYNFYRRGGYAKGGEDYRWVEVRSWPIFKSRFIWNLFSFGFISLFQELLLWAITVPLIALPAKVPLRSWDVVVAGMITCFILVETVADQQQWSFQNQKALWKRTKEVTSPHLLEDYQRGFLTHGLFARSRHPNVWAEGNIWLMIYASCGVDIGLYNLTCVGALVLLLLTMRSSVLTETLSSRKYSAYREYQRRVPMLVPSMRNRGATMPKVEEAATKKDKSA